VKHYAGSSRYSSIVPTCVGVNHDRFRDTVNPPGMDRPGGFALLALVVQQERPPWVMYMSKKSRAMPHLT
jgi:hypothetical protein